MSAALKFVCRFLQLRIQNVESRPRWCKNCFCSVLRLFVLNIKWYSLRMISNLRSMCLQTLNNQQVTNAVSNGFTAIFHTHSILAPQDVNSIFIFWHILTACFLPAALLYLFVSDFWHLDSIVWVKTHECSRLGLQPLLPGACGFATLNS